MQGAPDPIQQLQAHQLAQLQLVQMQQETLAAQVAQMRAAAKTLPNTAPPVGTSTHCLVVLCLSCSVFYMYLVAAVFYPACAGNWRPASFSHDCSWYSPSGSRFLVSDHGIAYPFASS